MPPSPQESFEEYTGLLVTLARQALASPRLAAPMPCLPHWMSGADHIVVAVSAPGAIAGLRPGDTLRRLDDTRLTGRAGGTWDAVLREMPTGVSSYEVEVARDGATTPVTLPCAPARAERLHRAERAMWTAVTRHDWPACVDHGEEMLQAFGAPFSPPLMVMTRCVAAGSESDPQLTYTLAQTLVDEFVAHPVRSPDLREQLFLTLRELDTVQPSGAEYATRLRARMAELGVPPPPAADPRPPR